MHLRDGGHALEEMSLRGLGNKFFNPYIKESIINNLVKSNIEIIELGSVSDGFYGNDEFSVYKGILDAYDYYQKFINTSNEFALIYRDPHIYNLDIPKWEKGFPKIARVIMRYFNLKKSFDFCREFI